MSAELPITEADLQAYVDGRLAQGRRVELEAWLAAHPEEAERLAAYRRIGEALHEVYDPVLDEPVPERLQRRSRARLRAAGLAASWMLLGAAIGAAAGWKLHDVRSPQATATEASAFVRRAALAHATYSPEVRHPVEVGADQEAHLVAWLSKRLGAPVRAPKLEEAGFSLVGGRLLPGDNGPVAHFMYESSRGARVTLYVRTEAPGNRETAFRYARDGNVRVFYWVDRKMGYALSSADLGKDELLVLANAAYQQLNP
jgi:anti-sigma factor RsiW